MISNVIDGWLMEKAIGENMNKNKLDLYTHLKEKLSKKELSIQDIMEVVSQVTACYISEKQEKESELKEALFQIFNSDAMSKDVGFNDIYVLPLAVLNIYKQSLSESAKVSLCKYKKAFLASDSDTQRFLLNRYDGLKDFIENFKVSEQ